MIDSKDRIAGWTAQIFVTVLGVLWLYPVTQMLLATFRGNPMLNYVSLFDLAGIHHYFINSAYVAVIDIGLALLCVTLAAYAFSKLNFPLREPLFVLFVIGLMIPGAGLIIPQFLTIKELGLINHPLGLIGPHVAGGIPFGLLLVKAYLDEIPKELSEAAIIDGCSKFGIFRRIILPLAVPVISTLSIFTFIGSWNDYLFPLIILQDEVKMTVTLLPQRYMNFAGSDYGKIYAALVLISLPIFVLFAFAQRFLQKGVMAGSVKA